jgi:hypothetical protein
MSMRVQQCYGYESIMGMRVHSHFLSPVGIKWEIELSLGENPFGIFISSNRLSRAA